MIFYNSYLLKESLPGGTQLVPYLWQERGLLLGLGPQEKQVSPILLAYSPQEGDFWALKLKPAAIASPMSSSASTSKPETQEL